MTVPIIDDMPIPNLKRRGATPKYPWLQLKPGQAFKFDETVSLAAARSMASGAVAAHKIRFAVRECADGIYCWRVDGVPGFNLKNGSYVRDVPVIENFDKQPMPGQKTIVMGADPEEMK